MGVRNIALFDRLGFRLLPQSETTYQGTLMRNTLIGLFVATMVAIAEAADVDPAAALAAAKTEITARNHAKALGHLSPAIEAANRIADATRRKQALTALHFYAAVASSGMHKDDEAASHLEEALRLTPTIRGVDADHYPERFVALFERVRGETTAAPGRFEELYPGFSPTAPLATSAMPPVGNEPAVEILGSRQEKQRWRGTMSATDRAQLLTEFWADRDQTPGPAENEFRDMFLRRVAFADTAFGAPAERGALTDRGRVFALLGPPALVRRRALSASEAGRVQALSRGSLGIEVGTVEYWIYNRDQLPVRHAQPTVTFRFISHQGVGSFVLQKDGFAINTLAAAASAASRE